MGNSSNPGANAMDQMGQQRSSFQDLISQGLSGAQGRSDDVWNSAFNGYQNMMSGNRRNEGMRQGMGGLSAISGLRGLRTDRPGEANMYLQAGLGNLAPAQQQMPQQQGPPQPSGFDNWMRMFSGLSQSIAPMLQNHYKPQYGGGSQSGIAFGPGMEGQQ